MTSWLKSFTVHRAEILEKFNETELNSTLSKLVEEGVFNEDFATNIRSKIKPQLQDSSYILKHLAGHLTLGVVFAADPLPLPLGTISRVIWVISARLAETARGRTRQARIHSGRILLIAAIPMFGYLAYFFALRKEAPEAAVLALQSLALRNRGCTVEELSDTWPGWVRRTFRPLWTLN